MKHHEISKIISNTKVAPEHHILTLSAPKIVRESSCGQFVMVKIGDTNDPLLRRPISLHNINKTDGTIDILFRAIGNGTRILSELEPGEDADLIGPLGTGFDVDKTKDLAILIGGGAGIAPLYALAKQLKTNNKKTLVLIGANNINSVLCEDKFKQLGCETIVATDDGTYGKKGMVTDVLLEILRSKIASLQAHIYACGPRPMVRALKDISISNKVPCDVSLEEWMACGIGACLGCTVNTKNGYKKVCDDGPVFNVGDLIW